MRKIVSTIVFLIVVALGFYLFSQLFKNDEIEGIDFSSSIEGIDFSSFDNQETETVESENNQAAEGSMVVDQLKGEILKEGTGQGAESGSQVTVHYVGVLEDGTKFDSSLDRGEPFTFTLGAGQVIRGWDLGVAGMKIGEIRRLFIPSEFGYGEAGTPNGEIPPNTNLIFDVELLAIN